MNDMTIDEKDGENTPKDIGITPVFTAQASTYAKKNVIGTFFTLITFGIYRAWFTTNLRKYLWTNTSFDGDQFEYLGAGRELLIGFIIAVVLILPIIGAVILMLSLIIVPPFVIVFAEFMPQIFGLFSIYNIFLLFFVQFAIYRGRAYRLSRTSYRGIRFHQTGNGWHYAFKSFLWLMLIVPTLGFAYPWMRAWQINYRVNNTWFGSQQASLEAKGKDLLKPYLKALFAALAVGIAIAFIAPSSPAASKITLGLGIGAALFIYFSFPYLAAREFKIFTSKIKLGSAYAISDFTARKIYLRLLAYGFAVFAAMIVIYVVMTILIIVLAVIFYAILSLDTLRENPIMAIEMIVFNPAFIGVLILCYLALILAFVYLYSRIFRFAILRHLVTTITVYNHANLVAEAMQGEDVSGTAAGIGDAIDVEFGF